jgi:centromere/kinetochore protein ZW10
MKGELEAEVAGAVAHIRGKSKAWKAILSYSAWASAIGSLVNTIAVKMIADVFDLSDIGVDEAERIAILISKVIELDDLFIRQPENEPNPLQYGDEATSLPLTPQFADKWMKLKFLNEVLQSNLKDIKFLWFESHLSLYFTVDEVIDLVQLSFENNPSVRQAIKELREKPDPMGEL